MSARRVLVVFWDRAAALLCVVVAVVVFVVGWAQLSALADPGGQIPYIMSGGIGGLFLLSIGATLWLSADLRDQWRKLDVIDESLRQLANGAAGEAGSAVVSRRGPVDGNAVGAGSPVPAHVRS